MYVVHTVVVEMREIFENFTMNSWPWGKKNMHKKILYTSSIYTLNKNKIYPSV